MRNTKLNQYNGSALIEYMLPTALIGLVIGVGLFTFMDNNQLLNFLAASANMQLNLTDGKAVIENQLASTSQSAADYVPPTSATSITKNCTTISCSIDFGSFKLENIPANINDLVETTGVAGGTESLNNLLFQIADQLEQRGDTLAAEDIKKLATLGHNIAAIEKAYEDGLNSCGNDLTCISNLGVQGISLPSEYNTDYFASPTGSLGIDQGFLTVGSARQDKLYNNSNYQSELSNNKLAYQFVDQFDKILDSTSIPNDVKGVVQELYWEIGVLGEDFQNNFQIMYENSPDGQYINTEGFVDPLTGESTKFGVNETTFDYFNNYTASKITNVDAALICGAGNYNDTGITCH